MKMSDYALALGILFVGAAFVALALLYHAKPGKPFERTCPDRSATDERLAYSTYHTDGRLECTYIPHTAGAAKRRINT